MNFAKYEMTVPYPNIKLKKNHPEAYRQEYDRYYENKKHCFFNFKNDLLYDLGVTDHPKADCLFNIAWDHGHSEGYSAVYDWALDLVELIK